MYHMKGYGMVNPYIWRLLARASYIIDKSLQPSDLYGQSFTNLFYSQLHRATKRVRSI